jgi:pimeloyl-ACP methyl ester carboxylesterase
VPTVTTDALELAYTEVGRPHGSPVLLLHGWPDAARSWGPVGARLADEGYRVLLPEWRGTGGTRFRSQDTIRDATAAALASDVLDLADAVGIDRCAVVGHDWGARVAYVLAAVAPERLTSITGLALAYQPRGEFLFPSFAQAQNFWYQWLMYVDAGAEAVRNDPVGLARRQWETWSPPGWWDEAELEATAEAAFRHPDWPATTLSGYRTRFLADEPVDARYDGVRTRIAAVDHLTVPTLMIQGGADTCDPPSESEGLEGHFDDYRRVVLDGVGHFPQREDPQSVADLVLEHLAAHP